MEDKILEMVNVTKKFSGVTALKDINLSINRGEIHALVGENGAGKSTLIKILSGVHPYGSYSGECIIDGEVQKFLSIKQSEEMGISTIHQELTLVKEMSIAENIFLGSEIQSRGVINWHDTFVETEKLLREVGLNQDPNTLVGSLGTASQQLIEVAKALSKNSNIIIFDEPTSSLTVSESDNLLSIIKELKSKGVTCIYISHKLDEVLSIADKITVLRDGQTIITGDKKSFDKSNLISYMVGREMSNMYPNKPQYDVGDIALEVRNWTVYNPDNPDKKVVDNVSFHAREGEILGIGGLVGAGRTELVMSIFGAYGVNVTGELRVDGELIDIYEPMDAIKKGVGYVTEDRRRYGLVFGDNIQRNMSLSSLNRLSKRGKINESKETNETLAKMEELEVKATSILQNVDNLSGGNQQKVVLAKWLMTNPKILIMDEPTRGIDVGSKYEFYKIMNELAEQGVCVIMISSELPELIGMSDRILVMHEGKLNGEFKDTNVSQEEILLRATGGK